MNGLLYFLFGALLVFVFLWLRQRFAAFVAQKAEDYSQIGPDFAMREHLNGPIVCEGVIFGPTGRVSSRFTADMHASWNGNRGIMSEKFRYDSGETQNREWRLTLGNDGSIRAEADDVIGVGTGQQSGSTVSLNYRIRLPEASGGHVLDATDWMYLVEDGKIINRSQFRKFGITVAELVATMRKAEAA